MTSRNSPLTKAVLLAAGKGTRMKELTADLPKPMISVGGKPVLEHIVYGLKKAGVERFLVITGYKEEVVRSHFADGSKFGVAIEYACQAVQDGTGRVVDLARDFAGVDPFILSYGDILVAHETYQKVQQAWGSRPLDGLLTLKLGEDVRKGAVVILNEQQDVVDLVEKPNDDEVRDLRARFGDFKPWYNAGIYAFTSKIFDYIRKLQKSPRGEYELTDALRQMIHAKCKYGGMIIDDYWIDVRDPEVVKEANRQWKKSETFKAEG